MRAVRVRTLVGVAIVGALALTGCGTSGGNDAAPKPSTTEAPPSPSTTDATSGDGSTTTTADVTEAGAQYLELAAPSNCALEKLGDAADELGQADATEAMASLSPKAAAVVAAYDDFADGLAAATWPPEVQDQVDLVIGQIRAERELFAAVAVAQDEAAFTKAYNALADTERDTSDVDALRAALGLDPSAEATVDCTQTA